MPPTYRCFYAPSELISDTGVYPFVQLRAQRADDAQRLAWHVTGRPIVSVERLEARA